ncbi:MAG: SDR family oxidoreductase [Burkholderiaceae bacterium]
MSITNTSVILITGASRGIGAAAARAFAETGATVALFARSGEAVHRLADEIRERGGRALAVAGDVGRAGDLADAVGQCRDTYGRLDVLINNAAVVDPIARVDQSDTDAWSLAIDINVKGVYYGLHAALPIMLRQGAGTIINISSGAASNALEAWSAYCASKAAVLSLTRSVHLEYASHGIRSVGLSPGTVATEMQRQIKSSGINPVSQLDWSAHIPAEWVGRALVWLAGEAGREFDGGDFSLRSERGRELLADFDKAGGH